MTDKGLGDHEKETKAETETETSFDHQPLIHRLIVCVSVKPSAGGTPNDSAPRVEDAFRR